MKNQPKDYVSTIMRMAGNIAAGLVTGEPASMFIRDPRFQREIALAAIGIAQTIVDALKPKTEGADAE